MSLIRFFEIFWFLLLFMVLNAVALFLYGNFASELPYWCSECPLFLISFPFWEVSSYLMAVACFRFKCRIRRPCFKGHNAGSSALGWIWCVTQGSTCLPSDIVTFVEIVLFFLKFRYIILQLDRIFFFFFFLSIKFFVWSSSFGLSGGATRTDTSA